MERDLVRELAKWRRLRHWGRITLTRRDLTHVRQAIAGIIALDTPASAKRGERAGVNFEWFRAKARDDQRETQRRTGRDGS